MNFIQVIAYYTFTFQINYNIALNLNYNNQIVLVREERVP